MNYVFERNKTAHTYYVRAADLPPERRHFREDDVVKKLAVVS